jgi:hypothetical protein
VEVTAEGGELLLAAPIGILPYQGSWGLSVGAHLSAQSNFARATGAGAVFELAVRPFRPAFEVFALVGYHQYGAVPVDASYSVSSFSNLSAAGGVRYSVPLAAKLSLFASAALGTQQTRSRFELSGGGSFDPDPSSFALLGSLSAGLSYRVGPGRLMFEAKAQYLPLPSDGLLRGNLGGLGFGAGYLFEVR